MTKTVKCRYCNKERILELDSQNTFSCCGHTQNVGKFTLVDITPNSLMQNQEPKFPAEVSQVSTVTQEAESHAELPPEVLEIEEAVHENPLDKNPLEQLPEPKKIFNCPNCNNQLKEYQAICENCNYEIQWQ